jgi:hypothetical protein
MTFPGALDRIRREVENWPGVESHPHRFGGTEFVVGRRELGHVHGDHILDAPLPRAEHDRLIAEGRAQPHHVLPESGWVTVPFASDEDVATAITILRGAYDRATRGAATARVE